MARPIKATLCMAVAVAVAVAVMKMVLDMEDTMVVLVELQEV